MMITRHVPLLKTELFLSKEENFQDDKRPILVSTIENSDAINALILSNCRIEVKHIAG